MHANTRASILERSSEVAFTWYSKADILHTVCWVEGYYLEIGEILEIVEICKSRESKRAHNSYGLW